MVHKKKIKKKIKTEVKKEKSFRIRSKTFFLTYSSLKSVKDYDNETLFEKVLLSLEQTFITLRKSFNYIICKELHEDGFPHIHILLIFKSTKRIYSRDKLVLNIDEFFFQGKYESAKDTNSIISYITKESGNFENISTNMDLAMVDNEYISDPYEYLLQIYKTEGYENCIKCFREKFPYVFLKKGNNILRNLQLYHQNTTLHEGEHSLLSYKLEDFNLSKSNLKSLDTWVEKGCTTTLLISGKSGSGKSELAKSIMSYINKTHLFIRNLEGLKRFCSLHQGIIYDDLDFSRCEDTQRRSEMYISLFDVMNPSEVRVLYGSVYLPAGLVKIITTNKPSEYLISNAVKRRIVHFRINNNLFNNNKTTGEEEVIIFEDH